MVAVSLGPLELADISVVLALLEAANLPTVGVEANPSAFVVARVGARIVGCGGVEVHGNDGLLRSVAVEPSFRRHRVGAALVQRALQRAEHERLTNLYLLTTTARDYFTQFGFVVCSREDAPALIRSCWEFRTGCPQNAVLMKWIAMF